MWKQRLTDALLFIATIGADARDSEELRIHKMVGITSVILGGIPIHFGYAFLFFILNQPLLGWFMTSLGIAMVVGVIFFSFSRNFNIYNLYWLTITLLSPFLVSILLGGIGDDGLIVIWSLVPPMLSLITNRIFLAFCWFMGFVVEMLLLVLLDPYLAVELAPATQNILFLANIVIFAGFYMALVIYYVLQNQLLLSLARREQQKSENLLLNILPMEIATRLKNEPEIIADYFSEVSILFADIVNFTPMSTKMSPVQLVELLDQVFSYFDALVEKYGLEKIKTIGDCYMVASGVPRPRRDHAQVLVQMALDIQTYMKQQPTSHSLSFRIGINSGPVVAGVIGRRKFIYDLWGDTVNTASRMESHGIGDTIQITEATYHLIKDQFQCEERGMIPIKGKGEMPVWHVKSRLMI